MTNPAFDAAMLLRGLRAMDAALGESYDVATHTCIPAPVVYSSAFPETGIDFSKYQGIEGLKGTWRGWMYEDGGQGTLRTTVHPDINDTVVEAFGILERCDESKEGLLTKSEWETCQNGRSAKDQLWDLEYLTALYNVTGKLLILDNNQPLNPTDPETYPELIQTRADAKKTISGKDAQIADGDAKIAERDGRISTLETEVGQAWAESSFYQKLSYGLGGGLGLVALIFGIRTFWRGRQRPAPAAAQKAPQTPKPVEEKPAAGNSEPKIVSDTSVPKTGKKPAASQPDDIADALADVDRSASPVTVGRPSGAPLTGGVTPENVVIDGPNAEPVSGVDPDVIRAQIALTYRHFLSQAARDALLAGRNLPQDAELVHSAFAEKVNEMVDKVTAEYHRMNPDALAEVWRTQREDRGYVTRRGVPQRVLMSVCGEFIAADAARAQSPFSGGTGAEIRYESERRAGETDFMTRGLREWMRHPGRK